VEIELHLSATEHVYCGNKHWKVVLQNEMPWYISSSTAVSWPLLLGGGGEVRGRSAK